MDNNFNKKDLETKLNSLNKEAKELKQEYNSLDNTDKKARKALNQKIAQVNTEISTCKRTLKHINNTEKSIIEEDLTTEAPPDNDTNQNAMTEDEYAAYMEKEYLKFEKQMEEKNISDSTEEELKQDFNQTEEMPEPTIIDESESSDASDSKNAGIPEPNIDNNDTKQNEKPEVIPDASSGLHA